MDPVYAVPLAYLFLVLSLRWPVAAGISSPQLFDDHLLCVDDLEGIDVLHGERVTNCCCVEWEYGARILQRRLVVLNERR